MINVIVIVLLVIVIGLAVRTTIKRHKEGSSCCGSYGTCGGACEHCSRRQAK